eukprot:12919716-Prorocentrum_lima.AAC.1
MHHPRNGVCVCGDQGNSDPEDQEGYEECDVAYEILDHEDDQEDAEEVDGSVMQVKCLPPGDDGQVEHQF